MRCWCSYVSLFDPSPTSRDDDDDGDECVPVVLFAQERTIADLGLELVRLNDGKLPLEKGYVEDLQAYIFAIQDAVLDPEEDLVPHVQGALALKDEAYLLSVLSEAAKRALGYKPRSAQLLSILLLIRKDPDHGRLLEVKTGEGKSLIIAILAAYRALWHGHRVDIVSSAENLARRDAHEYKDFYQEVGLTVGTNVDFYVKYRHDGKPAGQNVYERNILYGTTSLFEGDALRDFELTDTVARREKECLIVDEVDSLLVDSRNFITKLTDSSNGLAKLSEVRRMMWMHLNTLALSNGGQEFPEMKDALIEASSTSLNEMGLASHYHRLAVHLLPTYAEAAVNAMYHVHPDRDYIVEGGRKVVLVDRDTGELRKKMR